MQYNENATTVKIGVKTAASIRVNSVKYQLILRHSDLSFIYHFEVVAPVKSVGRV